MNQTHKKTKKSVEKKMEEICELLEELGKTHQENSILLVSICGMGNSLKSWEKITHNLDQFLNIFHNSLVRCKDSYVSPDKKISKLISLLNSVLEKEEGEGKEKTNV